MEAPTPRRVAAYHRNHTIDDFPKRLKVHGITVVDEISTLIEKTSFVHGYFSDHLLHPSLLRMRCDAGHLNFAAFETYKEQH
jgi:hypothetical protein